MSKIYFYRFIILRNNIHNNSHTCYLYFNHFELHFVKTFSISCNTALETASPISERFSYHWTLSLSLILGNSQKSEGAIFGEYCGSVWLQIPRFFCTASMSRDLCKGIVMVYQEVCSHFRKLQDQVNRILQIDLPIG